MIESEEHYFGRNELVEMCKLAAYKKNVEKSTEPVTDTLIDCAYRFNWSSQEQINWLQTIERAVNGEDIVSEFDKTTAPGYQTAFKLDRPFHESEQPSAD